MINPIRFHLDEITSTNDYAKELISGNELIIVTANSQINGRGRNSRSWYGDYGKNIYLTFGINHKFINSYQTPSLYQALGCLSVIKTLRRLAPDTKFKIKYPNDIYVFNGDSFKKISGVLVEQFYTGANAEISLIGIGINNEQKEFPEEIIEKASSLLLNDLKIDNDKLSDELVNTLITEFDRNEEDLRDEWYIEMNLIGKSCEVIGKGNKIITGFLPDGRLEVQGNDDKILVDNGDSIIYDLD